MGKMSRTLPQHTLPAEADLAGPPVVPWRIRTILEAQAPDQMTAGLQWQRTHHHITTSRPCKTKSHLHAEFSCAQTTLCTEIMTRDSSVRG